MINDFSIYYKENLLALKSLLFYLGIKNTNFLLPDAVKNFTKLFSLKEYIIQ